MFQNVIKRLCFPFRLELDCCIDVILKKLLGNQACVLFQHCSCVREKPNRRTGCEIEKIGEVRGGFHRYGSKTRSPDDSH